MKVVIMAGGRGTRISELFPDIPKPMIPVCGIPVLEREISSLKEQGFTDIILTVGYKAESIMHILVTVESTGCKLSTLWKKNHWAMQVLCFG